MSRTGFAPLLPPRPADAVPVLRRLASPALGALRAAPVWRDLLAARGGRGPAVAFLPARGTGGAEGEGASGASHLRIGLMAEALSRRGWRTLVLPWRLSLSQRRAFLGRFRPDLIVMQGVRHHLNRPALLAGCPILLDVDDADFHLPHLHAPMREAVADAAGVIAGSRYVADWARRQGAPARVVWTGTPVSTAPRPDHARRPAVVAWAQSRPADYAAEAEMVLRVMRRVGARVPGVRLRLHDRRDAADDALAARFRALGLAVEQVPGLGYADYLASFDDVAVGLAPLCVSTPFSRGKSFGKVLAYLDRHVPVVGSDAADHALFFTPETGVITNDEDLWVDRIVALLGDAAARQDMAAAAHDAFRARLTTAAAADRVETVLRDTLARVVT